jgi:small subunit ribosomal protein S14
MRKHLRKDKHTRNNFLASEKNRIYSKLLFSNSSFNPKSKWLLFLKLTNKSYFGSRASISRIKNYCLLSGRSRSIYRRFKISRILLREKASCGDLPGMKKASW